MRSFRQRSCPLVLAALVIAAGLASRAVPAIYAAVGKYPGDALWAAMVFFLLVAACPRKHIVHLALAATFISFAAEFSQLLNYPWLNSLRSTNVGHLLLGSTFNAPDLLAYAVGVLVALGVQAATCIRRGRSIIGA